MAGTITTNAVVLGDSATAANNFQLRTNTDGSMKLARGATGALGDILTVDASGNVSYSTSSTERMRIASTGAIGLSGANYGTSGQVLTSAGSGATPTWTTVSSGGSITVGTSVASTSGTSISFTGLPAGVKRITVMLNSVQDSTGSFVIVQLGTGVGPTYTTTGYVSGANNTTSTTGFLAHTGGGSGDVRLGNIVISSFGGNIWNSSAVGAFQNGAGFVLGAGHVSLGGAVTAVRVTTVNGTDTFTAGSINILYEI